MSAVKSVPSKKVADRPFWQELEDMLESSEAHELDEGHMKGSLSGESWKAFLKTVRDEVLQRLQAYQIDTQKPSGFCASTLTNYREEKRKIERTHLRSLVLLYKSAERAYKSVSG